MSINVAIALELRNRRSPTHRVWISARDVTRNVSTGEEPDVDVVTGPLCGVDATASGVETTAVGFLILILNTAANGTAMTRITVVVTESACEGAVVGDCAAF